MYDYEEAMKEDVKQWISEEINLSDWTDDREGLEEKLNDDLFVSDRVTGNASGSYTFNRARASEYVLDNTDLLREVIEEFDIDSATVADKFIHEDWEWFDVNIRCYMLSSVISEVLEEEVEKCI